MKNTDTLAHWISGSAEFNTLITVTLKQAIANDNGTFTSIKRSDCVKTAWLFRDRLSRIVLGRGAKRARKRLQLAAFLEGDDVVRQHLHIVARRPETHSLENFKRCVTTATDGLVWVYNRIDTIEIDYGSPTAVLKYCLKNGTDAFLPEASHLIA